MTVKFMKCHCFLSHFLTLYQNCTFPYILTFYLLNRWGIFLWHCRRIIEESVIYFLALWSILSYDKSSRSVGTCVAARKMRSMVSSKHIFILRKHISVFHVPVSNNLHIFLESFSFDLIITYYYRQTFGGTSWDPGLGVSQPHFKAMCKHLRIMSSYWRQSKNWSRFRLIIWWVEQ